MHVNKHRGFTLIELLVVMAVIAIFIAGVGLAITRGGEGASLRSGQRTLVTMVNGTRGQAALKQSEARLLIHADPDFPDRYLRFLVTQVRTFDQHGNPGPWEPVNEGTLLPSGVYVVPPRELVPNPPAGVIPAGQAEWPWELRSILPVYPDTSPNSGQTVTYDTDAYADELETYMVVRYNSRGKTTAAVDGEAVRIVLAPGTRRAGEVVNFDPENHIQAVGGLLRQFGNMTPVNDSSGFPELNEGP